MIPSVLVSSSTYPGMHSYLESPWLFRLDWSQVQRSYRHSQRHSELFRTSQLANIIVSLSCRTASARDISPLRYILVPSKTQKSASRALLVKGRHNLTWIIRLQLFDCIQDNLAANSISSHCCMYVVLGIWTEDRVYCCELSSFVAISWKLNPNVSLAQFHKCSCFVL